MAGAYDPPNEIPAQDTPELETLLKTETPRFGVVRVARWPEGLVLWVGGEIVWKSWTRDLTR